MGRWENLVLPHLVEASCGGTELPGHRAEVRRILRPRGRLHFLEHGLAPSPRVRRWQRRLAPVRRRVAGGCHLTREPVRLMTEVGFEVERISTGYLPGSVLDKPLAHLYSGRVVRRG